MTGSPTAAMSVDFVSCRHVCVEVFDSTPNGLCEPNAAPNTLGEAPSASPQHASKEALRNALSMCAYANSLPQSFLFKASHFSSKRSPQSLLPKAFPQSSFLQSSLFKAPSSKHSKPPPSPQSFFFQGFFSSQLFLSKLFVRRVFFKEY